MGYLDNTSITVDATLTKAGRKLLADGQGINIGYACFSDKGVDYRLYNPDHANGSTYYAEAIESMPLTEANASATSHLTDKLVTYGRHSVQMPIITDVNDTYAWGNRIFPRTINPKIHPHSSAPGGTYTLLITDPTVMVVRGASSVTSYNHLMRMHLNVEDFDEVAAWTGTSFILEPAEVNENHSIEALFVHDQTGIYKTVSITISANEVIAQTQITDGSNQ